ncbi:3'-5' exonuclease [Dictyobacter kobayashii]|uniref:Exonuclease domain-containing protein n=1 Tax=Dictyobacter kobayashii TaxID=2014872 RepID=A0A402AUF3_9CHLR|nr:3'-5' exonuclease [Dictyobacter kobayashii]GCE22679.1 hypothetical protein KDK_64790 [Dictyobacter kobayashii]
MALDNDERSQQNAALKRHGYRWAKENNQWILKDPQGKTTTPEKAIQAINNRKALPPMSTAPSAPPASPIERPAVLRWAQQIVRRRPLILSIKTATLATIDEIVELAIVDIYGQIIFNSLIKPGQPITSISGDVQGIVTNQLTQAPSFPDIWPQIYPLLIQNELIIYDAAFYLRSLRQAAARYQLALPAIVSHCMMTKYALYAGEKISEREYKIYDLNEACAEFGIGIGNQQASENAEAVRQLLLVLANVTD